MAKVKTKVEDEPADSFTSMIDIVFLLLIFFILQPFKAPELKLTADLPSDSGSAASAEAPREDIKVVIRNDISGRKMADGTVPAIIDVNGQLVATRQGQVTRRVEKLLLRSIGGENGDKTTPVALLPQPDVSFNHVIHALDACYLVGLPNVKFAGR